MKWEVHQMGIDKVEIDEVGINPCLHAVMCCGICKSVAFSLSTSSPAAIIHDSQALNLQLSGFFVKTAAKHRSLRIVWIK